MFVFGTTALGTVKIPADFIAEQIQGEECLSTRGDALPYVAEIISFDARNFNERGSSLTVTHDDISHRWAALLDNTFDAAARNDPVRARQVIDVIVDLARKEFFLNTPTIAETKRLKCWKRGNKNAKCGFHTTQHAAFAFNALMYSAIILREHLTGDEEEILDQYFSKTYRKYTKPLTNSQIKHDGYYEFGGHGLGVLAYANWTRDAKLAKRAIGKMRKKIRKVITRKGYIDNNSYRGVRAYWYHTLGADSIYGYAAVARAHGVDFFADPKVGPELRNLAEATLEGAVDYEKFVSKGTRGKNHSKDPKDARLHMHQLAVSLPTFIKEEFAIEVPTAAKYDRLSRHEWVDRIIGFNSDCYYSSRS